MGRLGSGVEVGSEGWSWVRRGSSQEVGVGVVRGVRGVEVEEVAGVWVEGRVGAGLEWLGSIGLGYWG